MVPVKHRRALVTTTLGIVALAGGLALGAATPKKLQPLPEYPLRTAWPAKIECPRFERLELDVDSRVAAVEWRGRGDRLLTLPVTRPAPGLRDAGLSVTSMTWDQVNKLSKSHLCGDEEGSCVLYPRHV